ncbi:MAG: FecR family protein, partial [Candidatus Competibacterales bacterium]|nr:FecR family protein [Candidatus Competibacterales bacterium]
RTIGPAVRLNGRITGDVLIYDGDRVSTGPNSSAYLYFRRGGYIHLDENTDPIFRFILDRIYQITGVEQGQFLAENSADTEHNLQTPDGSLGTAGTRYNLQVRSGRSVLTVYQGRVRWLGATPRMIQTGEQLVFSARRIVSVRRLSMAEMERAVRWRERFPPPSRRPPLSDGQTTNNPWEAIIPGIIGIGIGIGIGSMLDDDEPVEQSPPEERPEKPGAPPPAGESPPRDEGPRVIDYPSTPDGIYQPPASGFCRDCPIESNPSRIQ